MAAVAALVLGAGSPASAGGPVRAGAWGWNNWGQLGDGTTATRSTPVPVMMPPAVTFTELSGGYGHTIALASNGRAWGWGLNNLGQVGDGTNTNRTTPVAVQMPPGVMFTTTNGFEVHSLALATNGAAWAWGWNRFGQLGDGTNTNRNAPVAVQMPPGVTFTSIDAGGLHSVALDSGGRAWAWGDNSQGELGDGTNMNRTTPVLVQMPPGVSFTDVTGGLGFSMALDSDGKAWAWGNNANGQLGDGTHTNRNVPVPVVMPPGLTFTAISNLGDAHSLALAAGGAAWAWGDNAFGQVGDGTNTDRDVPVAVQMPPGVTFTSIYSGDFHSLGLAPDGTAWAWGLNNRSQLGDGTSTNRNAPVRVQTPGGVILTEVSAGDFHSLALGTRAVGS